METEMKVLNHSRGTVQKLAQDEQKWRSFVAAYMPAGIPGNSSSHDSIFFYITLIQHVDTNTASQIGLQILWQILMSRLVAGIVNILTTNVLIQHLADIPQSCKGGRNHEQCHTGE